MKNYKKNKIENWIKAIKTNLDWKILYVQMKKISKIDT